MTNIPRPEAFKSRLSEAETGDLDAQLEVAYWYLQGTGVAQNSERAAFWYKKAAEAGSSHAQYMLASRYKYGDGVSQDNHQAFYWFEQAAKTDMSYSLHEVGCAYFYGKGTDKNLEKAAQCFKASHEVGNVRSTYYFGLCLINGFGVEQNIKQGISCLESAARSGNNDAKNMLADITRETENSPVIENESIYSYQEIRTEWEKYKSIDINSRMKTFVKLTDSIIRRKETLTLESVTLYIEILKTTSQIPSISRSATQTLSRLMLEYLKLTGRGKVDIINEITSHDLGVGLYIIGDPVFLKDLSQWANQQSYDYLVDMMNTGKLLAFTTKDSILGIAHLRLVNCDEPVLLEREYSKLQTLSQTITLEIKSGQIGIYQWGYIPAQMNLDPGTYKICAYQLGEKAEFYIVMCKTDQPAKNNFELVPDLS